MLILEINNFSFFRIAYHCICMKVEKQLFLKMERSSQVMNFEGKQKSCMLRDSSKSQMIKY